MEHHLCWNQELNPGCCAGGQHANHCTNDVHFFSFFPFFSFPLLESGCVCVYHQLTSCIACYTPSLLFVREKDICAIYSEKCYAGISSLSLSLTHTHTHTHTHSSFSPLHTFYLWKDVSVLFLLLSLIHSLSGKM